MSTEKVFNLPLSLSNTPLISIAPEGIHSIYLFTCWRVVIAHRDNPYVARGLHLCGRTRLGYLSGTKTPWVLVGDVS
ncbi:hypothetical protein Hanom_Chr05g00425331 [Helianthus anomalus]